VWELFEGDREMMTERTEGRRQRTDIQARAEGACHAALGARSQVATDPVVKSGPGVRREGSSRSSGHTVGIVGSETDIVDEFSSSLNARLSTLGRRPGFISTRS
jgi:hypothetical protein